MRLPWPWTTYTLAMFWLPTNVDDDQLNSGLAHLPPAGDLWYDEATGSITLTYDPETLTIPVVFDADTPIHVQVTVNDTHAILGVSVNGGALTEVSATVTPQALDDLWVGLAANLEPELPTAGGTAGGARTADGVIDHVLAFQSLTTAERTALAAATTANDIPFDKLRFWLPLDTPTDPETTDTADTRSEIEDGTRLVINTLTRALVAFDALTPAGLTYGRHDTSLQVAAILATQTANDDIQDHRNQAAAQDEQELRTR